ncbi:MAG: FHA domain-containing protein, partial [Planctomycetales bacterium]|nr:FHA domain-containing protein [Planctomycetales bacterium]
TPGTPLGRAKRRASTGAGIKNPKVDTVAERVPGSRFVMWVDAVGGFLVCLGDEIVLGPPTPDSSADVPILGDISRRHAILRRDREGYLVQPLREVKLDGRPLSGPTTLTDGNVIELGEGVQLRFRRPHALSMTARLEMISRHRFDPAVDAVLLMADSCVLGPARHSHVPCRDWPRDVVLFRQAESLTCRHDGPFEVDGAPCEKKASVEMNSRVVADEFSFSLERLDNTQP